MIEAPGVAVRLKGLISIPMVRLATVLAAAVFVVTATPPVGAAGSQPTVHVSGAHFQYLFNAENCAWGIGIEFPEVGGAVSYQITYYDGYYKQMETGTETKAQLSSNPQVPKGTLYSGITGGASSPPCSGSYDATEGGRFTGTPTVLAFLPEKSVVVSGLVTQCVPTTSGCVSPVPKPGVEVTARGAGGPSVAATTGADGRYEMALPKKGRYFFTPYDPLYNRIGERRGSITTYLLGPRFVDVTGNRSGIDFNGYDFSDEPGPQIFKNIPPGAVGGVVRVKSLKGEEPPPELLLKRGGHAYTPIDAGETLRPGDRLKTNGNTVVELEMFAGGRVGINADSMVEVGDERKISNLKEDGLNLSKGGLWAKCGKLKEPLEIQTNGGVMGIKG